MSKKFKCFWCNGKFVDLIKHTEKRHPQLDARSYDNAPEVIGMIEPFKVNFDVSFIDPKILDMMRGIIYKRPKLSFLQKMKIYFGLMERPKPIKVKAPTLMELIPKVTNRSMSFNGWEKELNMRATPEGKMPGPGE